MNDLAEFITKWESRMDSLRRALRAAAAKNYLSPIRHYLPQILMLDEFLKDLYTLKERQGAIQK